MKNKKSKKVTVVSAVLFGIVFAFCFLKLDNFQLINIAKAGISDNLKGWLWGGTEDATDGAINGNETGAGWISLNSSNYGVNVPSGDGYVTGYAWSSNLGWIDFNPQTHCTTGVALSDQYKAVSCNPPSGSAGVTRTENSLDGWARIVGIAQASVLENNGGWDGWIDFYNVTISDDGILTGYSWNGENEYGGLGWIDFSGASLEAVPRLIICPNAISVRVGKTSQTAAYYSDSVFELDCSQAASYENVTSLASWSSNDPAVATVDNASNKGLITGVTVGPTTVSASYVSSQGSVQDSADITVIACVPDCSCASSTYIGETCEDGCGGSCDGIRKNLGTWQEVAP